MGNQHGTHRFCSVFSRFSPSSILSIGSATSRPHQSTSAPSTLLGPLLLASIQHVLASLAHITHKHNKPGRTHRRHLLNSDRIRSLSLLLARLKRLISPCTLPPRPFPRFDSGAPSPILILPLYHQPLHSSNASSMSRSHLASLPRPRRISFSASPSFPSSTNHAQSTAALNVPVAGLAPAVGLVLAKHHGAAPGISRHTAPPTSAPPPVTYHGYQSRQHRRSPSEPMIRLSEAQVSGRPVEARRWELTFSHVVRDGSATTYLPPLPLLQAWLLPVLPPFTQWCPPGLRANPPTISCTSRRRMPEPRLSRMPGSHPPSHNVSITSIAPTNALAAVISSILLQSCTFNTSARSWTLGVGQESGCVTYELREC